MIVTTTIKTCVFDMGNVLVNFSHELMCRQMGELCSRDAASIRRSIFDSGLQADFERGRLSPEEFHRLFIESVGVEVDADDFRRATSDIFELNEGLPAVLDALKAQGIRLVLMSNTSVWHFEFIRDGFDVLDRFDVCVTSYAAGAIKPEEAIYRTALEAIECAPGEAFYTDDVPEYVERGRQYGMQADVFTGVAALRRRLEESGISC